MLINNIRKSPTCPIRNTIHAPVRGTTDNVVDFARAEYDFNPHSYKRSDFAIPFTFGVSLISIHAPTRGATR